MPISEALAEKLRAIIEQAIDLEGELDPEDLTARQIEGIVVFTNAARRVRHAFRLDESDGPAVA